MYRFVLDLSRDLPPAHMVIVLISYDLKVSATGLCMVCSCVEGMVDWRSVAELFIAR